MDFRIGIVIGASLWLVTEQQHPDEQACTSVSDLFEPCGCILNPKTIDLNCGSDGNTYLSMCFLYCRKALDNVKISVAHKGVCYRDSRCSCRARYEPVCGTDGITYTNECTMKCFMRQDSTIRLAHTGECESGGTKSRISIILGPDEPENQNRNPRNGNCCCHSNLRRLRTRFGKSSCGCVCRHERKTEAPQKPLRPKLTTQPPSCPFIQPQTSPGCPNQPQAYPLARPPRCTCAMIHRPVCGNNDMTYANLCVIYCISTSNPSVQFQYWGVCGKKHANRKRKQQ